VGFGGYEINSFLNKLVETLLTAIQYFHGQKQDFPMGVGRNLAYKKRVF
jgi:hypothetical protein